MSYLKDTADYINSYLNVQMLNRSVFQNQLISSIAQSVARHEGSNVEILPCLVDPNGEARYLGPDDDFDYMAYHKVNSFIATKSTFNKGYGDSKGLIVNQTKMSYVVFGNRSALIMSNDELAVHLQTHWPDKVSKTILTEWKLSYIDININDIILNDLQVFNEEYQGVEFFLKPEQYLFKVNYTIESAFDKKCFITTPQT